MQPMHWMEIYIYFCVCVQAGSLFRNGDELMVAVTGAPLNPEVFLDYLRKKYTDLYKL